MEITAVRNTDYTTPSTLSTPVREQSSTPTTFSTTVQEQSSSRQKTSPADETTESATIVSDEVGLNSSTSTWTKKSSLSTSSEFVIFITRQTEESLAQNIDQNNSKASVRIRIIMIAAISSTSFILLLIFLGWIHYRRRQIERISRQKNTGGSRVLPPLPYGHGDAPFESKDYSMNHTYNLPFSTSLDNIYESVPDQKAPDPTKPSKSKKKKKRSKSKPIIKELTPKVIQPSEDYATYADIPELSTSSTTHRTSSIVHADVHRLSTFATEEGHHVDQSTGQSLRVIDASGYLSPNVEISSTNINPALQNSSEDKRKHPSHTNSDAGITVVNKESAENNVGYECPEDVVELNGRDTSDVNGFITNPGSGEEMPYEVLEDNPVLDADTFDYLVSNGFKTVVDDVGYAAVDEISKSHTDNLGYEVPSGIMKGKGNGGYYEVTNDNVKGNEHDLKHEVVPGLIANANSEENQSESDGLGYLVPNTLPEFQANLSKSTTETEPDDDNDTGAIQHTYIDCGNSMVQAGSHPANSSIDSEGKDDKYSVIPDGSGWLITEQKSNNTEGKIPNQIYESNIDSLGYLVPRVTRDSQKRKTDEGETDDGIIHHTYLDCNDSMLVERDYSEISNELRKDLSLGPRLSGKGTRDKNTPDERDSFNVQKSLVCRKVADETHTPRLQHTYQALEGFTLKQSQYQSLQHQARQSSGGQKSKLQISENSNIHLGKEEDNINGNTNLDIHGYMVLDETHM